jgi:orotate phosphoribosyltransferase
MDIFYQQCYEEIVAKYFRRGNFTLSNGMQSDYYIDIKSAYTDKHFVNRCNAMLYHELNEGFMVDKKRPYGSIGGLEAGAIPILASLSQKYGVPYFWVRKAQKEYGLTEMNVIGEVKKPVVIIEDVLNSGSGINKVANAIGVRDVMGIVCVVNRYEFGDRISLTEARTFDTNVVDVRALYKLEDFVK